MRDIRNITVLTTRPFHLLKLSVELASLNINVTVYGYMPKQKLRLPINNNFQYVSLFWHFFPFSAIALQRWNSSLTSSATEKLLATTDRYVEKKIQSADTFIGLSGCSLKSLRRAKKINALSVCERGSAHVLTHANVLNNSHNESLGESYIDNELKSYEACDVVSVPSKYAYNSFLQNGYQSRKLLLNTLGVDLDRFKDLGKKRAFQGTIKLLFVGAWSYCKGCDIFDLLLGLDKSIHITHVGSNGGIPFPMSQRFTSLGHVPNIKLNEIYAEHDIFVLPSRQDGFGMVILEALACGLPVIASNTSGGPDIKEAIDDPDSVQLINAGNPHEILLAIFNLKEMSTYKKSWGLSKKDRDYYSWNSYAKRYIRNLELFQA